MTTIKSSEEMQLPANAYKELAPNENYVPPMRPEQSYAEITPWSVFWGLLMAVLFAAAAAYSGLKVGQVMETGIPIAVLAVGLSRFLKSKQTLGQNVIIQSIGSAASGVIAGAIFVLPALYILDLSPHFMQMFLASVCGGFLGVLFLIPLRKYFVKDMHGKLPFPEATAATEILVAGEKGGKQALVLITSGLIGGINDFLVNTFGFWRDTITSRLFNFGAFAADKFKVVFKMNTLAMILGLGYIIGLRYAVIICAGSFLSWFVFIPLFHSIGFNLTVPFGEVDTKLLVNMSAEEIFRSYIRYIGIGAITVAGLIGIVRSSKIIYQSFGLALKGVFCFKVPQGQESRCQRDIRLPFIMLFVILTALMIFVFLVGSIGFTWQHALAGLGLVLLISFLFTTVAANAIAIVGTNPVSGMTLMTLLLTAFVLNWLGFSGSSGILSALIIGGMVCTALAVSGAFITDLKIGYWLGSTPYKQESLKFLGMIVSAATVIVVIYVLNQAYGFKGEGALVAPQANAMAAVIQPLMAHVSAPWVLYFVGAVISILLTMLKIPALPFALGMYLPQDLNTPLLLGGFLAWLVAKSARGDAKLEQSRSQRGTLIASGFIAGGALFGVVGAFMKFFGFDFFFSSWEQGNLAEIISVVAVIALCAYLYFDARRARD